MPDVLDSYRALAGNPAEAIRWACLLEATAPKAGNVYPGRPFADLTFADFVAAAEITARWLARDGTPMSQRMLGAVQETRAQTGSNVNLGIVLLLGPLVAADQRQRSIGWRPAVAEVLGSWQPADGQRIFEAIFAAAPGGLGSAAEYDIQNTRGPVDVVAAMTLAADRDRVARQYATGYADLFDNIVPRVEESIREVGDVLLGIRNAQLRLLAAAADSLIERKNGPRAAEEVRRRAAAVTLADPASIEQFDRDLRRDGNRWNPGTTADLIVASLYAMLRTGSPAGGHALP